MPTSESKRANIVLMSDFGLEDGAAKVMEAVIQRINPSARVVHLTHSVSPHNVAEAGFLLLVNYWHFPETSVFVPVVDPGVGTERKILLLETKDNYVFVGPDNGLFWPVMDAAGVERAFSLDPQKVRSVSHEATSDRYFQRPASTTFHGRDIFSPAAALLSLNLGDRIRERIDAEDLEKLSFSPEKKGKTLVGKVVYVDRFGNVVTNITRRDFDSFVGSSNFVISAKDKTISSVGRTFSAGGKGGIAALFGGDFEHPVKGAFMTISMDQGNAASALKIRAGEPVAVELA